MGDDGAIFFTLENPDCLVLVAHLDQRDLEAEMAFLSPRRGIRPGLSNQVHQATPGL